MVPGGVLKSLKGIGSQKEILTCMKPAPGRMSDSPVLVLGQGSLNQLIMVRFRGLQCPIGYSMSGTLSIVLG